MHGGSLAVVARGADELADLEEDFADELVASGMSAIPTDFRSNPRFAEAYKKALVTTSDPERWTARKLSHLCATAAHSAGLSEIEARCAAREARLPEPPKAAKPSPPTIDEHPWLETRQARPCSFVGSAEITGEFHDSERAGQRVATTDVPLRFDVASMDPPANTGARARVEITWPIRATWWLGPTSTALELAQRVDLVQGHVWLPAGTKVRTEAASGTSVIAVRDLTESGQLAVEPRAFRAPVACAAVRLAHTTFGPYDSRGEWRALLGASVSLFDAPGGKPIARIAGGKSGGASAHETQGRFTHVTGQYPFSFDGWVATSSVGDAGPLEMVTLGAVSPASHHTRSDLPLRLEPKSSTPIVAYAVQDVNVVLVGTKTGFAEIRVSLIRAENASHDFFVEQSAFEAGTTPIQPP